MKKMKALLLVLVLSILLAACGQAGAGNGGNTSYSVKVTDAQGVPYTAGVIVKFMKDGAQVAMQSVDANGVVTIRRFYFYNDKTLSEAEDAFVAFLGSI